MKKLKLVMIGNGMAGVRTLEELLKLTNELYDITVFGAEPHPNYNRILLSPCWPASSSSKRSCSTTSTGTPRMTSTSCSSARW